LSLLLINHSPAREYIFFKMRKSTHTTACSSKVLKQELTNLNKEPVEGFRIEVDEQNFYKWDCGIFGPPGTMYQGGYFKAIMNFPKDYPYSPPNFIFKTKMWHPNIYDSGEVCISILHPPGQDEQSGELACERWTPTQNVRTILLSVISLLNEPNISSPANVEASVQYRRFKKGPDDPEYTKEYEQYVRKLVQDSIKVAENDGIFVPTTEEEYTMATQSAQSSGNKSFPVEYTMDDMFDDDYCGYSSDDMDDDDCEEYSSSSDSDTKKPQTQAAQGDQQGSSKTPIS